MFWLFFSLFITSFICGFFQTKLVFYSALVLSIELIFMYFDFIGYLGFFIIFILSLMLLSLFNIKKIRRKFISKPIFNSFEHINHQWKNFQRIDDGWFASDFEKSIFHGSPEFISLNYANSNSPKQEIEATILALILPPKHTQAISFINSLAKLGGTSLLLDKKFGGQGLNPQETSDLLKNISKINPILAAIVGLLNYDSLTSFIHHFGSIKQKKKFLPHIANAKLIPFLKPTSLYETLESQKSSTEGRIETAFIDGKEVPGIRLSFENIILLGSSRSNGFYLNVNIKDFNNLYGETTHLGTGLCIFDPEIAGIEYKRGLKAFDNYLYYYTCSGKNVFIPFDHIINETDGIGHGLKYMYVNQYISSSVWPLAIAIPTNNITTLTSWYFAHLQKQNGRQLVSYKLVLQKLNEQFSQSLTLKVIDTLSRQQQLKFTAILNKNAYITKTMEQLGLLRSILGSNSHNIKTESNIRSFYKLVHLSTELDGMSYEINQLPLIKKAALACHPFYDREVKLLMHHQTNDLHEFDRLIFRHIGYIFHNFTKIWICTLQTSLLWRVAFPKHKFNHMIKRMSASFAFVSDISLINWTFKTKINTSFASHLGECLQQLTCSLALHDYYINQANDNQTKRLAKTTLKNCLYSSQVSLKETINLAFNRLPSLLMKILIFPLGRPFHKISVYKPLHNNIEQICNFDQSEQQTKSSFLSFLEQIQQAKQKLQAAQGAEIAVSNATGTPLSTDNYETLINRCLAAGIVSVEQSEQLRDAYSSILEIKLINHFGVNYEKKL